MIIRNSNALYGQRIIKPSGEYPNLCKDIINQNHTLIAGATGSGKSVMIHNIVYTLILSGNVGLYLCDPKMVELRRYRYLPQVECFADTEEDILRALTEAKDMMMRRFEMMAREDLVETRERHVYVIIDELADLMLSKSASEIEKLIQKICQVGRAAHVHCIAATQAPSRQVLKAPIVLNMTCRIALRCESSIESRQIVGKAGAENLPDHGYCVYKRPGSYCVTEVIMVDKRKIDEAISFYLRQRIR